MSELPLRTLHEEPRSRRQVVLTAWSKCRWLFATYEVPPGTYRGTSTNSRAASLTVSLSP